MEYDIARINALLHRIEHQHTMLLWAAWLGFSLILGSQEQRPENVR